MRLIFIPGFGEEPSIFDRIHPHIQGEKVFLNNWVLLGDNPRPGLNALQYASELVERFDIKRDDLIIGHSMGGWIAFHIKHLVQCPVIQIGSWTDGRKVVRPVKSRRLVYWLVKRGLYFNSFVKRYMVKKYYQGKPSAGIFSSVFENLIQGNKENVVNQLRIIFNPVSEAVKVNPDLRIHARRDNIVRYPNDPTHEVHGDHFTLYTQPEEVYQPIVAFLQELSKSADRKEKKGANTRANIQDDQAILTRQKRKH